MIWTPERNAEQGRLVVGLYAASACVPRDRQAVMAAGLPGADRCGAAAQSGTDLSRYLAVSVDTMLKGMAACGLIPAAVGLSPMEASQLVHAEAQFLAKRVAMLAMADGRNLLLEVSMASRASTDSWIAALHATGYAVTGVFAEISIEESVRQADAAHRHGQEEFRQGRGHGGRYIPLEAIRALAGTPASGEPGLVGAAWYPGGGEVSQMIGDYQAGQISLADLVGSFRSRTWTAVPRDWAAGLVSRERDSLTFGCRSGTMTHAVYCERGGSVARP
jgi:zeta toxin